MPDQPGMPKMNKKKEPAIAALSTEFKIKYPFLWLAVGAFILYLPTISTGLIDLDDGVIINTYKDFNENLLNLLFSFKGTYFDTKADLLYRPVSYDIMILNYHLADHGANIAVFHLVSVLLHVTAVLLVYKLFIKLGVKGVHAFILTLIFAVHPVLASAVSWIAGRIETILCIFVLAFFIKAIDYADSGKIKNLLLSLLFLLLALFDKETAVVAAPAAFILLVVVLRNNWLSKRNLIQYCSWTACYVLWFVARSSALRGHQSLPSEGFVSHFVYRMPTMIQYIGKIFLPFNLSVFPLQEDTVYYYGIAASAMLMILLFLNKKRNVKLIVAGLSIFILFLAPTFLIPKILNVQIYEYRLYVPMIGILLLLTQTPLLQNKLNDKQLLTWGIMVCAVLACINFEYQKNFSDPLSFWTQAEASSPHSAYAKMMLSARIDDPAKSETLFLEAYKLDPDERQLNFIYGVHLQDKDSILASEKYFLAEKIKTGYYECDFYLARVAMEKKDLKTAIGYLESYIKNDSKNLSANNNLLLLYLDTDQEDKAKAQAQRMKKDGLEVPKAVLQHFNL